MQNLSYRDMAAQEVLENVKAAIEHTRFALHKCEVQSDASRYFMFEHRVQARAWNIRHKEISKQQYDIVVTLSLGQGALLDLWASPSYSTSQFVWRQTRPKNTFAMLTTIQSQRWATTISTTAC